MRSPITKDYTWSAKPRQNVPLEEFNHASPLIVG